ncbi:MAG: tetratricopeptide repeat protein [bacterium]
MAHTKWLGIFLRYGLILVVASGCSNAHYQDRHMKRADRYFELKQYQNASIEYGNVLQQDNTNIAALCQMGLCSLELNNPPQAVALVLRAERLAPDDFNIKAILARLYQANGTPAKARELALAAFSKGTRPLEMLTIVAETAHSRTEAEDALRLVAAAKDRFSTNADYYAAEGLLSLRLGDVKSAEASFHMALDIDSAFARGYLGLAMLHQLKGDREQAERNYRKAADLAGIHSPETIKWALFELQTGKPEEAKRIFEAMAATPSRSPLALLQLTKIAMSQRQFAEAEKAADRILSQFPNHIEARLLRAQSKLAGGKTAAGLNELKQMVVAFPHAGALRYELALALAQTGAPDKAISELHTALQLKPDYSDATLLLADLFIRTGDAPSAIQVLSDLLLKHPDLGRIYVLLGASHQSLGQFDLALTDYAKLGQLDPKSPQSPYLTGLIHLKQKNREAAIRSFTQASTVAPGFTLPLAQLVSIDLNAHQGTQALARIDRAIELTSESGPLCYLQGQIYLSMGSPDQAEAAFRRAIEFEPESISAYVALSRLYLSSRREDEALRRLSEALQKAPHDPACLMLSALLRTHQFQFQTAADLYEELIKIRPDFIPALNNLACLYADNLNQLEKGRNLAMRARDIAPHDPYAADTLGWILFRSGDTRWAASLLQESAEALPTEGEVLYHLARTQLAMGREAAARDTLRAAMMTEKEFLQKAHASRLLTLLESPTPVPDERLQGTIREILKEDPDNPSALTRLAALQASRGDSASAVKIYEQVGTTCPTYYPASLRLAAILLQQAASQDRAFSLACKAHESAPDDPEAAHLLGWIAYQKNQYKWALSLLLGAAGADARNPQLLYHLALAKYRTGQEQDSIALARQALAMKQPFEEASDATEFLKLTNPDASSRSPQSGLDLATQVLARDPANFPAFMLAGRAQCTLGHTAEAKHCYETLLAIQSDFAPALLAVASLYAASGESEKALEAAQKARVQLPDNVPAAKLLGGLSLAKDQNEYAAALFQEVITRTPRDPEALLGLGQARMKLRETDAARKALKQVIEVAPVSASADVARHSLNELAR